MLWVNLWKEKSFKFLILSIFFMDSKTSDLKKKIVFLYFDGAYRALLANYPTKKGLFVNMRIRTEGRSEYLAASLSIALPRNNVRTYLKARGFFF